MVTAPADDWGTEKPAARPATTLDSMRSSGNGGFGEAAPF
jgi:hypothetical protein